jgi:hypothetical protein
MNRGRSTALLAAALMALFAGLCATTAQAVGEQVLVETDHLRVSVPEGFPEKWAGGPFFPIRLRLENRTSRPLQASFFTDDRLFNGVGGSNLSSARTGVQIPPGVSTRDVFLPLAFHHGQSYRQIVLEAEGVNGRVHRPVRHGDLSGTRSYLLVTQDGDKMDAELSTALKGVPWKGGVERFSEARTLPAPAGYSDLGGVSVKIEHLPADPRTFLNASGMWIATSDWNKAGVALKQQIKDWVRAGGWMYVHRDASVPVGELPESAGPLGLGRIEETAPFPPTAAVAKSVISSIVGLEKNPYPGCIEDYQDWKSDLTPRFRGNAAVLIFFLAGFSAIAVPLNLRFFAPVRHRHRLFVTVPVISALALVGLVVAVVVRDGTGGIGVRNAILLLTPGETRAALYQEQLSRCGMMAMRGFEMPEELMFTMLRGARPGQFLRSGRELSGDWFRSREVQGQVVQGWVPSRSSVVLKGGAVQGRPVLESSVASVLGPVYLVGGDGRHWKADRLVPGGRVELGEASAAEFEAWMSGLFEEPSRNLTARVAEARARRGWFFGVAQDAGLFVATSPQIAWKRDRMLCLGPVEQEVKP